MGVVYRAYDPELDREVALKSVQLEGVTAEQRHANEVLLAREARAAARLQHAHTVAVYDFFGEGDRAFIVMELVRGVNLDAMLATGDTSQLQRTLQILREAAAALDAAHAAGIVHRDVKPGNILLDEAGHVKIADFGIARVTAGGGGQTAPSTGAPAGTLAYMSPEQVKGEKLDGRSDQFALAIVAYQLMTGQLPFPGETWIARSYQILHEAHVPARTANPALPEGVGMALDTALQKDPARRFPTCSAFVDALAAAVGGPEKVEARSPNRWILTPILLCVTGLIVVMIFQTLRTVQNPPPPGAAVVEPESVSSAPAPPAAEESRAVVLDGIPMDFAAITPGRFVMGCQTCDDSQKPEHMVEITKPFQIGRTEVTERHWNAVMTGKATGANRPKVNVSWTETQQFLAKLNGLHDGFHYRLPTEAEWEYCARAHDPGIYPKNQDDVAWTSNNSRDQLQEPATATMSNLWGIYDMLGNASEWTNDWMDAGYYKQSPASDPRGPAAGSQRVFRGGNGGSGAMLASYAFRSADDPETKGPWLGFRVVRERV